MMKKLVMLSSLVFVSGLCGAQANAQAAASPKQYRLTFVLSYPNEQRSESFSVNVPVAAGKPGVATITASSGSTASTQATEQQTIQCMDVHESAKGLAASVSIAMDKMPTEPAPGMSEPIYQHMQFNKRFDVVLNQPTRISEEMHYMELNKGVATEVPVPPSKAAPQISVTVTEI